MRTTLRRTALTALIMTMAVISACSGSNRGTNPAGQDGMRNQTSSMQQTGQPNDGSLKAKDNPQGMRVLNQTDAVIPITTINNTNYISARELANTLNYQTGWSDDSKTLQLGDNDANFELSMNTNKASKEGSEIQVASPFVMQGDSAYIPVAALGDLFQEDMSFEIRNGEIRIHPNAVVTVENEDDTDESLDNAELEFAEDADDPFKTSSDGSTGGNPSASMEMAEDKAVWQSQDAPPEAIPVLKNIDINAMISTAKKYLGVKYLFGADPYPKSGKFDCSTYTKYVFGKYGVTLPRLARQQANIGTLVSRKNLRRGDLMFFYVPGRFKTNRTVGHVGIYIGNMQMIHSSPKPKNGVQITNINKPYWKQTFLKARRVAY